MSVSRGRPPKCEKERFVNAIMNFKNFILYDNKIVPRSNKVWSDIAITLNNDLTVSSLYSMVTVNQYGILEMLGGHHKKLSTNYENDSFSENVSLCENVSKDTIDSLNSSLGKMAFEMFISSPDFDALTTTTTYKCSQRKWNQRYKQWRVFKRGLWEDYISKLIWQSARLSCGFNFRNHYVNLERNAGRFDGYCKCGSVMKCNFDEIPLSKNVIAKVEVILGSGKCGKRWLREPLRSTVCMSLEHKSVEAYRAEKADGLMLPGDSEPSIIPSSNVLRTAKSQYIAGKYLDPDPVKALVMMKYGGYTNFIQDIGIDPFFVQYGTNQQLQAYKSLCAAGNVCVCLDSTGTVVRKLKEPSYRIPKHIFLHAIAVNTASGQFTVAHMLSEVSHTVALETWIKMWLRSGAPIPSQCVTDDSRALLNAVVRSFTALQSIEDYADALKNHHHVQIYIRIDVAHFLKKYSMLLKLLPRRVKTFYLASIGQLIKCSSMSDAETLIKAILIVSQSETEGTLPCGRNTACEDAKNMLKRKITEFQEEELLELCETTDGEIDNAEQELNNGVDESKSRITFNLWTEWAESLNKSVMKSVEEQGDRENAHFVANQKLSKYLIKDLTLYPLWSCLFNEQFGLPEGKTASSAPIEGEFSKLKNAIFKKGELPLRLDRFVARHLDYLSGKMKLVGAKMEKHALETNIDMDFKIETPVSDILRDYDKIHNIENRSSSINQIPTFETNPSMCSHCNVPSGSHECIVCGKKVHLSEKCSKTFNNENLEQIRVCTLCSEGGNLKEILNLREFDNWRNKGKENNNIAKRKNRKRKALYLGDNKTAIKDKLSHGKHASIPMIKNASSMDLASIRLDGKRVTLTNTCAFDSMFHLLLTATYDFESMSKIVEDRREEVGLFGLIEDVRKNGVSNKTYTMRANVLKELHSIQPHPNICDVYIMDCETNIGTLSRGLLKDIPSFKEISVCNKGCQPRIKYFPAFNISRRELLCENRENLIRNCISLNSISNCINKNCDGSVTANLLIGDIVVFDVDTFKMFRKIKLESLPLSISIPDEEDFHLMLVGMVNYKGSATNEYMGHYTAISYRRADRCWVEYDDLIGSSRRLTTNTLVQPALTVMLKIKK